MKESPFISIITVVYNGEKHIRPTMESISMQTYNNYEHVVIDGKSSDNTLDIVNEYKSNDKVSIISELDKGVYDAMNKGLHIARGKYLLFINAGDELNNKDTLSAIFGGVDIEPDVIYGETLILNEKREVVGTRTQLTSRKLPQELKMKDFLKGQVVSHQSFIVKKSLCKPYNLKYRCSSDIDWQLDILRKSAKLHKSTLPISKYLQGGISDKQLATCWIERFKILNSYFDSFTVIMQHLSFALRYIRIGRYKN